MQELVTTGICQLTLKKRCDSGVSLFTVEPLLFHLFGMDIFTLTSKYAISKAI